MPKMTKASVWLVRLVERNGSDHAREYEGLAFLEIPQWISE